MRQKNVLLHWRRSNELLCCYGIFARCCVHGNDGIILETTQMNLTLTLTLDEVNGIIAALGELPTKTNAMFLIQKIQAQAQDQLPKENQDAQKVS